MEMTQHDRAGSVRGAAARPVWLALLRGFLLAAAMTQVLVAHGCHRDDEDHDLFTNPLTTCAARP